MTLQKFRLLDGSSTFVRSSQCIVTEKHITEMYDRFESGLSDQTTCNGVALALSEMTGSKVRVFRRNGSVMFESGGHIHSLPEEVMRWLEAVDRGMPAKPFHFETALPA